VALLTKQGNINMLYYCNLLEIVSSKYHLIQNSPAIKNCTAPKKIFVKRKRYEIKGDMPMMVGNGKFLKIYYAHFSSLRQQDGFPGLTKSVLSSMSAALNTKVHE